MRRPREQRHRLGLVELSRLSTLTPIAAVVVEVQTEAELAIQVSETAEITKILFFSQKKRKNKKARTQRPAQPHRGAPLVLRFLLFYLVPEKKACEVPPTARYYRPQGQTGAPFFWALPDLPTPSHQLSN